MQLTREIAPYADFCLEMEYLAAEPYLRFVYDDPARARSALRHLFEKGGSEVAAPHCRLFVHQGEPLGMVTCCPGPVVRRIRFKAAVVLSRLDWFRADPGIARRIDLARQTLIVPETDDFYAGRLGASPRVRGAGLGFFLLRSCAEEARSLGFRRLVGEVHPSADEMLRLCTELVGFRVVDRRRVEDPESGRSLEYLHLAKDLVG